MRGATADSRSFALECLNILPLYIECLPTAGSLYANNSETKQNRYHTTGKGVIGYMKTYKKLMNALAGLEKLVLEIATVLILVLTVGNVFSRKVIHQSWSFTEELVVAVFVLITLLAAALACRDGELVNLTILTDRLPAQVRKVFLLLSTILSVAFTAVLFKYGLDKVITQMQNGKRTFVLNWPEWIFWSFVPIGAACMILHFIEFYLDSCGKEDNDK